MKKETPISSSPPEPNTFFFQVLGKLASSSLPPPSAALDVQNKDAYKLPIILEPIPAAKAFKAAIQSLSPEQARFASAYRNMQLEGSIFACLTVEIRPALEKLLLLPEDSLMKELQLCQSLLDILIQYQIPSDMLSYDGPPEASKEDKIKRVQELVAVMEGMLQGKKDEELAVAEEIKKFDDIENDRSYSSVSSIEEASSSGESEDEIEVYKDNAGYMAEEELIEPQMMLRSDSPPIKKRMMKERAVEKEKDVKQKNKPEPEKKMMKSKAPKMEMSKKDSAEGAKGGKPSPKKMQEKDERKEKPKEEKPKDVDQAPAKKADEEPKEPEKPKGGDEEKPKEGEKEKPKDDKKDDEEPEQAQAQEEEESDIRDYTSVATQMDALMEQHDPEGALRPTIVKWGDDWTRRFQKGLLLDEEEEEFDLEKQKTARASAFDLLDCLSRSGGLTLAADIHIVVAATHCFTKSLVDCVVQDSINPIEKLERSSLIVATTIHEKSAEEIVNPHVLERVKTYTSALF